MLLRVIVALAFPALRGRSVAPEGSHPNVSC